MGTYVFASYQAVNSAWNFALNALDSVAIAGQTLVGAALGAKDIGQVRYLTRFIARCGAELGIIVGLVFAALGIWGPGLFSPDPQIQHLISISMLVVAVFFPFQGWMWALDGILIGAGDFAYLAAACSAAAAVYIAVLWAAGTALSLLHACSADIRIAILWLVFNITLMGLRGLANGLRAYSDRWIIKATAP